MQTYLTQFFNTTKFVQNLAFSTLEAALLFPRKLATNFSFLAVVLDFMLEPGPNSVPEPEMHYYGSGSAKAKSCGARGSVSGSTTLMTI